MPPAPKEAAFGVVEVLIAVLMIMVVSSGILLAMSSGTNLRSSTRLQTAMTTTGQRLIETLANDNEWMKSCGAPRCAIGQVFDADDLELEDAEGSVEVVGPSSGTPQQTESHAVPVDSQVDGTGAQDQDGVIPDHYQVLLVIRPDASTAARYNRTQAQLTRRLTTALDRDGNILKGSLRVDACVVRNQVDERMSIDGCNASGITNVKMDGCPTNPPAGGAFVRCTPAWNWVAGAGVATPPTSPSPFVALERLPTNRYSFTIRNLSTGGAPIPSSQADVVEGGRAYVFKNIESGTYRIQGLPAAVNIGGISHPRWRTKEIPTYHNTAAGSVGVQPGVKNHALVMFRPPRTGRGVRFYFDRLVHYYRLTSSTYTEKTPRQGQVQLAGEEWSPTTDYQGDGARDWCDSQTDNPGYGTWEFVPADSYEKTENGIYKSESVYTLGPDYDFKYSRQCWIYMTDYATDNTRENCHIASYRYTFTNYDGNFKEGASSTGSSGDDYTQTWCTWFRDEFKHKFWHAVQAPDRIKRGAVKTAVYEMAPRPTTREINFGPGGTLAGATYPRNFCKVRGHTTNRDDLDQWECSGNSNMHDLWPGLNTDMFYPSDAAVSTNGNNETNGSNAVLNQTEIAMPGWARAGGLWVRTNGSIQSPTGSVGTNPLIHLRGNGECYWYGGLYLSNNWQGAWEGSCGRCNITWKTTVKYNQKCAMLERTCVRRYVAETSQQTAGWNNPATGVGTLVPPITSKPVPINGGSNCRTYNPEWVCDTTTPTIVGGNSTCSPPPTGPPPGSFTLSPTSHQVSQGTANVGSRDATTSPGLS